jgi:hypothetical protein
LKLSVSGDTSADSTTSGCVPIAELALALDELDGFDELEPVLDELDELGELLQAAIVSTASAPRV